MTVKFAGKISPSTGGVPMVLEVNEQAGVASYTTTGDDYTLADIAEIKAVLSVTMTGGYVAEVVSYSGAVVNIKVTWGTYGGGAAAVLGEITAATALNAQTITIVAVGQ